MVKLLFATSADDILGTSHGVYAPKKLDFQYQRIYARALPFLGVNSKIKREWRTLPEQYQGLGMPNFPLLALSEKLTFLVGNWGLIGQAHSDALAMA